MSKSIVIVEDEKGIRQFLEEILTDHGFLVHSTDKGTEAISIAKQIKPDMMLLDLKLPDMSGEDVCRKVKEETPETTIIMLTAKDTDDNISEGLKIGADDYITKPFSEQVLLARIDARMREAGKSEEIISIGDLTINYKTLTVSRDNKQIQLTPQEFRLLTYMVTNRDRVLSREMILSRIWNHAQDVETRVVDVYIGYLRKKLSPNGKKQFIYSKRGFGYMFKS